VLVTSSHFNPSLTFDPEVTSIPGNSTDPLRFLSKSTVNTYAACTWVASLTTLLFGVFKCRSMAEILFGLSEADAQLELQEKHYDKLKVKITRAGQNLGRVFNFRSGRVRAVHLLCYRVKLPSLKLKTWPKQLPLDIALPSRAQSDMDKV
jgi:hypothetical protein